jgi:hypothetical protein
MKITTLLILLTTTLSFTMCTKNEIEPEIEMPIQCQEEIDMVFFNMLESSINLLA